MQFRTEFSPAAIVPNIDYTDSIVAIGSCFAETVSHKLFINGFKVYTNPFGVVFHPLPLANQLLRIISNNLFDQNELVQIEELFVHWQAHGHFKHSNPEILIQHLNTALLTANQKLANANWLLLTLGSAYGYYLNTDNQIVANCHRAPSHFFHAKITPLPLLLDTLIHLVESLLTFNPTLHILLTISPVRHYPKNPILHQQSKAPLILAAAALTETYSHIHYFPAYELIADDLRDYRFYAADLCHPAETAIEYIWQKFIAAALNARTQQLITDMAEIQQLFSHQIRFPETAGAKKFVLHRQTKLTQIERQYPEINFIDLLNNLSR